jgi:hypothetical protein
VASIVVDARAGRAAIVAIEIAQNLPRKKKLHEVPRAT